jgi:hypothetical protein
MASRKSALIGAGILAVACCGYAGAATYDVVIVEVARGTEDFSSGTLQGIINGTVSTSNLPLLSMSRVDYSHGGVGYLGSWSMSDGGTNSISGEFQTAG